VGGISVVICGAGLAGIEGLLRLRRLAGDEVDIALVSEAADLVYRPQTVTAPFDPSTARRYPIARILTDCGARWERDLLSWVDRGRRIVHTRDGREIAYDALLLATGAREVPPSPHARVFTGRDGGAEYRRVLDDLAAGRIESLVFVQQPGPAWLLPIYELALLTSRHARDHGRRADISVVVPDPQPLPALGPQAATLMTELLHDAGINLYTASEGVVRSPRRVELAPSATVLHTDAVIELPTIAGPNIRGIPGYAQDRFVHVDEYCRVRHTDGRIFAAGDVTALPVKHGGIGAQQADTAAAGIARLAGCGAHPDPLRPVVNAALVTADGPRYLSAHLIAGQGWHTRIYEQPPWNPADKLVAAELGDYLRLLESL
jgi:sulfide:quinone oxidoreductase